MTFELGALASDRINLFNLKLFGDIKTKALQVVIYVPPLELSCRPIRLDWSDNL